MEKIFDELVDNVVGHLLLMAAVIIGILAAAKAGAAYLPTHGLLGMIRQIVLFA